MRQLFKLLFLLISSFCVLLNSSFAQEKCNNLFNHVAESPLSEAKPLSSIDKATNQLEIRIIKLNELLEVADNVTKRQGLKTIEKLHRLIDKISRTQDITDSNLSEMMLLMSHVEKLETQLSETSVAQLMDPLRLRRYLFTREAIDHRSVYYATLPVLDYVRIHFSKNVTDYFNSNPLARERVFPYIFKGKAAKTGDSGLKQLNGIKEVADGKEWTLWELKVLGHESRILIAYAEGELYFYKVILNHHRIDYGNFDYLKDFLKTTSF